MITKNGNKYEFAVNGISGTLECNNDYILNYQNKETTFSNLKFLHLYVNALTDIVEHIDSIKNGE